MRWWLLSIFLVTALSAALALFRHPTPTLGAQLAAALEAPPAPPLRGAIQLLDYLPAEVES